MEWTDRVKARLRQKGFRQIDLASKLNVTESAVSQYLKGKREPTFKQLKEIATMLEMSMSEVLGDDAMFITEQNEIKAVEIIKQLPKEQKELAIKILESLTDKTK